MMEEKSVKAKRFSASSSREGGKFYRTIAIDV